MKTQALDVTLEGIVAHGMEGGAVEVTGMESGAVRIVNHGEGVLVALVAALAIVVLGKVENVVAVTVLVGITVVGAVICMRRENKAETQAEYPAKQEDNRNLNEITKDCDIMQTEKSGLYNMEETNVDDKDKSSIYTTDDDKTYVPGDDIDQPVTLGNADIPIITIGSSVQQAALTDMPYCVAAALTIINRTLHTMREDNTFVTSGHVKVPAREIRPNYCEAMAMHKYSGTATGSYGVTSFALGEAEAKLVILWGVPYNQNHRSNWLGLVIVTADTEVDLDTFSQMWYRQFYDNTLKDFYYDTNMATFSLDKWKVEGTMGTAHKTEISVTVYQQ